MLAIKNCQISLYYDFNKIIKETGTSFQSPVLSQKHVRNDQILVSDQISFSECLRFKRNKQKWKFHY